MNDAERQSLNRLVAEILAEPDAAIDPAWRRAANLLNASRPDATARLLQRLVRAVDAGADTLEAGASGRGSAAAPAGPGATSAPAMSLPLVAGVAAGVGVGVVAGGLALSGLDSLLDDPGGLLD